MSAISTFNTKRLKRGEPSYRLVFDAYVRDGMNPVRDAQGTLLGFEPMVRSVQLHPTKGARVGRRVRVADLPSTAPFYPGNARSLPLGKKKAKFVLFA